MLFAERWFGPDDPVRLEFLAQVPVLQGIVTALHDVRAGESWPEDRLSRLREQIEARHLRFCAVESIPVSEPVKLGLPERERHMDSYCASLEAVARVGVKVVCYNFMPVFDWTRTTLAEPLPDGSIALSYDQAALEHLKLGHGGGVLPGWAAQHTPAELQRWLAAYRHVDEKRLWENLECFLKRIIPVAEANGVSMALHPDDPPWSVLGLPRIVTNAAALQRVLDLVPSPANGLTFCTGSLGANPDNDLPGMIRQFGGQGRIGCRTR